MPNELSIPSMPRKQIELWDITSTSGNFRPYQIQTAIIHFKYGIKARLLVIHSLTLSVCPIKPIALGEKVLALSYFCQRHCSPIDGATDFRSEGSGSSRGTGSFFFI